MPRPPILKRLLEGILSIGASPSESESQRARGRRERNEERVPLGVDLHPSVVRECLPKDSPMLGEGHGVTIITERPQKPCRPLDVRE